MASEGRCYVRYVGANPHPLDLVFLGSIKHPGKMTFAADPAYGGDRVEAFQSRAAAEKFLIWQSGPSFEIAENIVDFREREAIRQIVQEELDKRFGASDVSRPADAPRRGRPPKVQE